MEGFDDDLRRRLSELEATLVDAGPNGLARRRRSRLTPVAWLAAAALLIAGFAGGATARELVDGGRWTDSGLFTPGGALYCSGLQGMVPSRAAPILSDLGYEVTWQIEDGDTSTRSYQTTSAPSRGFVHEGIQNGRQLVIVVDMDKRLIPPDSCR